MERICAWHEQNFGFVLRMGETEPFEDKSETGGICPVCSARLQPQGDELLRLLMLQSEIKRRDLVELLNYCHGRSKWNI